LVGAGGKPGAASVQLVKANARLVKVNARLVKEKAQLVQEKAQLLKEKDHFTQRTIQSNNSNNEVHKICPHYDIIKQKELAGRKMFHNMTGLRLQLRQALDEIASLKNTH
jgi:hypothetical protein